MQLPLYIHNYINKKISYEETCAEIKEEANYTRVQLASSELVPSELLNFMGINETHIPVLLSLAIFSARKLSYTFLRSPSV